MQRTQWCTLNHTLYNHSPSPPHPPAKNPACQLALSPGSRKIGVSVFWPPGNEAILFNLTSNRNLGGAKKRGQDIHSLILMVMFWSAGQSHRCFYWWWRPRQDGGREQRSAVMRGNCRRRGREAVNSHTWQSHKKFSYCVQSAVAQNLRARLLCTTRTYQVSMHQCVYEPRP